MLREAAGVFARLLQRVLVERLVVGLLTGLSALCRVGRLGLGGRGLLSHAPPFPPRTGDPHVLLRHARLPFRHAPMWGIIKSTGESLGYGARADLRSFF